MVVMHRRRLLVLASTYPALAGDGTPAFVRDLAVAESSRYETTVLVPSVPGSVGDEVDGALEVRRFRFFPRRWEDLGDGAILENLRSRKSRWLQVPAFFLAEVLALRRLVRSIQPDVLHVHWLIPQGLAALVAAPHVPKLVTTLGGDLYGLRGPVSRRLIRLVLANSAAVTTMNTEMRDKLIRLGADPAATHVLPMGADVEMIRPLAAASERQPNRILFVGRLVEKKGTTFLLSALKQLGPDGYELRIVGDGPLRSQLEGEAAGLPVLFLGSLGRRELAAEYGAATVAVFPSVAASSGDQDGLPVAMLEAMSAGCPIVASRLPGIADAIVPGESGLLVEPGSASQIADALRDLLSDDGMRSRLGAGASVRADSFSVSAIGGRYLELLDDIVQTAAGRAP
jgi:colanic acid/amylovoran biosynthesis glycosyltransferase